MPDTDLKGAVIVAERVRSAVGRAESGLNCAKAAGRDRVVAVDESGKPAIMETG